MHNMNLYWVKECSHKGLREDMEMDKIKMKSADREETWEEVEWASEEKPTALRREEYWTLARGGTVSLKVVRKLDRHGLGNCLRKWGTRENEDKGRWLCNVYWSVKVSVAWSTASDSNMQNEHTH